MNSHCTEGRKAIAVTTLLQWGSHYNFNQTSWYQSLWCHHQSLWIGFCMPQNHTVNKIYCVSIANQVHSLSQCLCNVLKWLQQSALSPPLKQVAKLLQWFYSWREDHLTISTSHHEVFAMSSSKSVDKIFHATNPAVVQMFWGDFNKVLSHCIHSRMKTCCSDLTVAGRVTWLHQPVVVYFPAMSSSKSVDMIFHAATLQCEPFYFHC